MVLFNFRVRQIGSKITKKIQLEKDTEDGLTYGAAADAVAKAYGIERNDVQLSINYGKTALTCLPDDSLQSVGIVPGDLLILLFHKSIEAENLSHQGTSDNSNNQSVKKSLNQVATAESSNDVESGDLEEMSYEEFVEVEEPLRNELSAEEMRLINRYLNEPVLLRDSTNEKLPDKLEQLIEDNLPASPADHVILCLYMLLCEGGFQYTGQVEGFLTAARNTPSSYSTDYKLPMYDRLLKMVCVVMGQTLLIHGKISTSDAAVQLKINMSMFTENTAAFLGQLKSGCAHLSPGLAYQLYTFLQYTIDRFLHMSRQLSSYFLKRGRDLLYAKRFKNLSKLSMIFKDEFVSPMTVAIQEAAGFRNLPDILRLPVEMIIAILRSASARSVLNLSATCRQLRHLYTEPIVWRSLYLRTFGACQLNALDQNWYELYKQQYKLRCDRRRAWQESRRARLVLPYEEIIYRPDRPLRGIIGGSYDIDPLGGSQLYDLERPSIGLRSQPGRERDILDHGIMGGLGGSSAGILPTRTRSRPRNHSFQPFM